MVNQKKRKTKVSAGTGVGSHSVRLNELQKVLLGKGLMDSMEPCGIIKRKK